LLEILEFIFSSFWIWFGASIMLSIVCGGVARWLPYSILQGIAKRKYKNDN